MPIHYRLPAATVCSHLSYQAVSALRGNYNEMPGSGRPRYAQLVAIVWHLSKALKQPIRYDAC